MPACSLGSDASISTYSGVSCGGDGMRMHQEAPSVDSYRRFPFRSWSFSRVRPFVSQADGRTIGDTSVAYAREIP